MAENHKKTTILIEYFGENVCKDNFLKSGCHDEIHVKTTFLPAFHVGNPCQDDIFINLLSSLKFM